MDSLGKLQLPAILHWDLNHFIVLTAVRKQSITIIDPARGERRLARDEVSSHFTGVALELSPNENFKPREETRRIRLGDLVGRLPGLSRVILQLFLLAAAIEVFSIVGPLLMQLILDQVVVAGDRDLLTVLALGFTLITLIRVGVSALRSWVSLYLGTKLNLHLLTRLFSHLLTLPMPFFGRRHLGDLVSRFESLGAIRRTITTTALEILVDGLMAVVTAFMMFLYSVKLGLVVCGVTLIYGVLRVVRYGRSARHREIRSSVPRRNRPTSWRRCAACRPSSCSAGSPSAACSIRTWPSTRSTPVSACKSCGWSSAP